MGFLIKECFCFPIGFRHIYTLHINLFCFFGVAFLCQLIAIKNVHPSVLFGKFALTALVDVEMLYCRHIYGFLVFSLLREKCEFIKIAVVTLF